ncbi:hypothetical protein B0I18_10422 [Taibaiella chishuiensis]|uniref:Uncharacterized protein n=2 Tax=Taibaiella chishuiensis TaxID=1434707 RepID=A0A2P8D3X3_9BACT|nr:hypothetical protein B0I18_10422 [Taibaiella chishuiensis]
MADKKQQDIHMIDVALNALYNNGDKTTRALNDEILIPNSISLPENEVERLWDILLSTNLVNPVIGFGNAGKLTLTNSGYQLMNQYGSYSAFLDEKLRQAQGQNMIFPQFIIEPDNGEKGGEPKEDDGDQQAVGQKQ